MAQEWDTLLVGGTRAEEALESRGGAGVNTVIIHLGNAQLAPAATRIRL
jgi:hypothetical protein